MRMPCATTLEGYLAECVRGWPRPGRASATRARAEPFARSGNMAIGALCRQAEYNGSIDSALHLILYVEPTTVS